MNAKELKAKVKEAIEMYESMPYHHNGGYWDLSVTNVRVNKKEGFALANVKYVDEDTKSVEYDIEYSLDFLLKN